MSRWARPGSSAGRLWAPSSGSTTTCTGSRSAPGSAHGREWLVEDFLPDLMKERAAEGLIVHGPVVMFVDEHASSRFARSMPGTRVPV